jgi:hypothetical protein
MIALAATPGAHAEAVRSEGVGTVLLAGSVGASARAAAQEAALVDAVRKVAETLAGPTRGPAAENALAKALGPDPTRFVLTYRKVSEREQAAARPKSAGRELAVTIEAQVDRARLADALRRAGLLAERAAPISQGGSQRIVLEPVPSWSALAILRRRFVELGAQQVLLAQVEPGRVVLAIEGRSAESLARAVASAPPPGIWVEQTGGYEGAPRMRLESVPIAPAAGPGPIDTPAEKR